MFNLEDVFKCETEVCRVKIQKYIQISNFMMQPYYKSLKLYCVLF